MDNLLGVADQVWLAGFWLNSGLQGEARANGKLDTSSLALHYLHGLPRPVYWVLWLWRRLRGEILFHDKNLLLLHHQGHYQLLLRNTVVYNPWLSSEAAFIQRFSQPYSVRLQGLEAAGASNSTCSISTTARCSRWWTPFAAAAAPTPRIISG
jgi:beta-xylosidase